MAKTCAEFERIGKLYIRGLGILMVIAGVTFVLAACYTNDRNATGGLRLVMVLMGIGCFCAGIAWIKETLSVGRSPS